MTTLQLVSPLSGWLSPLSEAPDSVFAEQMMGPGIGIDPTDTTLCAPCDGVVASVARTRHCLTVASAQGLHILMHLGIDTVELGGQGFTLLVKEGQKVVAGQALLEFDMDLLARRAKSLFTPIVVTQPDSVVVSAVQGHRLVKVGDLLVDLDQSQADDPGQDRAVEMVAAQGQVELPMSHGLHARPAAMIARCAKAHQAEIRLLLGSRSANAKSVSALMSLGARCGDQIEIQASGDGAEDAVAALIQAITSQADGSRQSLHDELVPAQRRVAHFDLSESLLRGVAAAPGLAVGPTVRVRAQAPIPVQHGCGEALETEALDQALADVRKHLRTLIDRGSDTQASIMSAHLELLDDPDLRGAAQALIDQDHSAAWAWHRAVRQQITGLQQLDDAYLEARVADYVDLERQVLARLGCGSGLDAGQLPANAILLVEALLPSQLASLEQGRVGGVCASADGPTSHGAMLAAAMNIPALVAVGPALFDLADNTVVILNADQRTLHIAPSGADIEQAHQAVDRRRQLSREAASRASERADTEDGQQVHVMANLASAEEAATALAAGADGCGLLRTEFLFLHRRQPPGASEQEQVYRQIATRLGDKPLVIRTLDIGGDKPAPFLPLPREDNPALGVRGIRTRLLFKDLFRTQLQAILGAAQAGQQCRIMIPMLSSLAELEAARATLDEVRAQAGRQAPIALGVMIETPAAAVLAESIVQQADFMSIGTNDLTQYALAMDRANSALAAQVDSLHPAVLRLIAITAKAGQAAGKPVAVCGAMAADPVGAAVLVGLGITELSVPPPRIATTKALVRAMRLDRCQALAETVLQQNDPNSVRELALRKLPQIADYG